MDENVLIHCGGSKKQNLCTENVTVGVLTTNSREKGQKHVNKTSAEVAEVVACREKSSEQQLFLPFSALYRNVCIKTLSSLSTTTSKDQFNIILLYGHGSQNTEDNRQSSSYAIERTTCDKCTLNSKISEKNFGAKDRLCAHVFRRRLIRGSSTIAKGEGRDGSGQQHPQQPPRESYRSPFHTHTHTHPHTHTRTQDAVAMVTTRRRATVGTAVYETVVAGVDAAAWGGITTRPPRGYRWSTARRRRRPPTPPAGATVRVARAVIRKIPLAVSYIPRARRRDHGRPPLRRAHPQAAGNAAASVVVATHSRANRAPHLRPPRAETARTPSLYLNRPGRPAEEPARSLRKSHTHVHTHTQRHTRSLVSNPRGRLTGRRCS
ncbi:Uncharacterized protein FWK35_00033378 [Aphis craccivora]|uniref:Uncharacterized protein n=1 Tax=Aphis craccivora TaxID=307492 RepID=A0A6G0YRN5_APHCR|nr:Uncharacterized protein FWK35_00033378 [Aphis craccivora]